MTIWYIMRGSGLAAFALLTVTVALGIANATRWQRGRWTRAVVALVHRNASLLAVVFLGVHITTAVLDTYVNIPALAAVVPGLSGYRALWVALGTITFDLILALVVTSLLRARIGRRTWRAVHWTAYACWPVALTHAVFSGTDTGRAWTTAVYVASGALMAGAVANRLRQVAATRELPDRPPVTTPQAA